MDPALYKFIHYIGIFMFLTGLGAYCFVKTEAPSKAAGIVHGIGLLIVLVAGFGMAKDPAIPISAPWFIWKVVIWAALGAMIIVAKRKLIPPLGAWFVIIILAGTAAWLGFANSVILRGPITPKNSESHAPEIAPPTPSFEPAEPIELAPVLVMSDPENADIRNADGGFLGIRPWVSKTRVGALAEYTLRFPRDEEVGESGLCFERGIGSGRKLGPGKPTLVARGIPTLGLNATFDIGPRSEPPYSVSGSAATSMSYQVFARKYRPRTFRDVLGQDHVVQTLRNAIAQDRLAHAYLFVGPRGTGKTSTARIFAKALNCSDGPKIDFDPDEDICLEIAEGRSLDVLEIDGASNNGVEQVRELRETVSYAPARGRFKIYYIDEVHMLSNAAFNALLKTLEEPPAHVKFIFATTEPSKILPTIISRCQRFDLRPIPTDVIAKHLLHIANAEDVTLDEAAAWAIAKGADGGMRDAQSMLDQLVAFCGETISEEDVQDIFGFTSLETVAGLAAAIFQRNTADAISLVHDQANRGKDLSQLLSELAGFIRAVLIGRLDPESSASEIPADFQAKLAETAGTIADDRLLAVLDRLADADSRMRRASNKQLHFEIALIRAVQALDEVLISDVVKALEKGGGTRTRPLLPQLPHRPSRGFLRELRNPSRLPRGPPPRRPPTSRAPSPRSLSRPPKQHLRPSPNRPRQRRPLQASLRSPHPKRNHSDPPTTFTTIRWCRRPSAFSRERSRSSACIARAGRPSPLRSCWPP